MSLTTISGATPAPVWHTVPVEEAFQAIGSSEAGLSKEEAARRLATYGPNELQAADRVSPLALLFAQFKNVLIIILLVAVGLSAFLGHGLEAIVISVIVLFAVLLGFIQEFRAERALEALQEMAAPNATVRRGGEEDEIPAREVVPGDVIRLRTGDRVPADARIFESVNLQLDEAPLTGESTAVEKHTSPLSGEGLPVGDRRNMAYAGTAATYGRGLALVVATGMTTEFGKIAGLVRSVEAGKTPLQENLDRMGAVLARASIVIVLVIVAIGIARGESLLDMFVFGIALAVAVVPEALPAVVTISLAIGVQRMVKRHALVRRLPTVEALGSTSVICSDKTGTLTKDEMTARKVYVAGRMFEVTGAGYAPQGEFLSDGTAEAPPQPLLLLLRAGALASDARLVQQDGLWDVRGDPTEGALVVAAAKGGLEKAALDTEFPRTGEVPFTSETKRMTTLHTTPQGPVAYAKGAPEVLLAACAQIQTENGVSPLDAAARDAVLAAAAQMATEALRVLAVATKPGVALKDAETDMTLLGLVGLMDPPRPEAKAAIATCEAAGIRAVMITGDHPATAEAVARELGMLKTGRVVTGPELEAMSDDDLDRQVEDISVYARVSPAHKLRIVSAWRHKGRVVAMTGDGVNDAPALKQADVGIAMGITGTDVSKEAASVTLTDDNFASIVAAVEEGRGIFENIKKYLMYLLSANIGEIGIMVVATFLGMPLPLAAVQILYINLATDGLPALALAVDPPDEDLMRRTPRDPRTGIFSRPVVSLMLIGGVWSAITNIGLFAWVLGSGRPVEEAMAMIFVSLVLIEFMKAYNYRSDRHSILRRTFSNKWLNLALVWELSLLTAILYVPFLQEAFGTFPLAISDWMVVIIPALTITPVLEFGKWMVRRGWLGE